MGFHGEDVAGGHDAADAHHHDEQQDADRDQRGDAGQHVRGVEHAVVVAVAQLRISEVAAQIAVQYMVESFQREAKPRLADPFLFLSRGLTNAHCAILDYADERDIEDGPRTTCVACVIQDSVAYWAHAGDSRLYVLRAGHVMTQTRDHSRVQRMIDRGLLDEFLREGRHLVVVAVGLVGLEHCELR